jgi:chromosomal replication initiation ATPase DnaA|tara:strand:+ start:979 stop:1293 length:315 start_codon:yes stop_codon:yes gene_type:complete
MIKEDIFDAYAKTICKKFKISAEQQMFQKTKKSEVVHARYTLYYMCSKRPMRTSIIQQLMRNNGYSTTHSCIIYGLSKIKSLIESDEDYEELIKELQHNAVYIK